MLDRSKPRYLRQLSAEEIAAGEHRDAVGGMWDSIGPLQLEFMRARGLERHHDLLDVGCGALRGGTHFVGYLQAGRYCGMDLNPTLLDAGREELRGANLAYKDVRLVADDQFEVHRFGRNFDYAVAISLFTHLPLNSIVRCLVRVGEALRDSGEFYSSFFQSPEPVHLEPIEHWRGIYSYYDLDPYHYPFSQMQWAASVAGLRSELVGEWGHPRNQRMLLFTHARS